MKALLIVVGLCAGAVVGPPAVALAKEVSDVLITNTPDNPVPTVAVGTTDVTGSVAVSGPVSLAGPVSVAGPVPVTVGDVATRPSLQGAFTVAKTRIHNSQVPDNLFAPAAPFPAGQELAISSLTSFNAQDTVATVRLDVFELSGENATCNSVVTLRPVFSFEVQPHETLPLTFPTPMVLPGTLQPETHSWCFAVSIASSGGGTLLNQMLVTGFYV